MMTDFGGDEEVIFPELLWDTLANLKDAVS